MFYRQIYKAARGIPVLYNIKPKNSVDFIGYFIPRSVYYNNFNSFYRNM